jgi:hypothetical protein
MLLIACKLCQLSLITRQAQQVPKELQLWKPFSKASRLTRPTTDLTLLNPHTHAKVRNVALRSNTGTAAYKAYQKLYKGQADDIIQKMFKNHRKKNGTTPAADPINWAVEQNVVVGGVNHQCLPWQGTVYTVP